MLKVVKGLVLFMGMLIVAGLGVLGYGLYARFQSPETVGAQNDVLSVGSAFAGPGSALPTPERASMPLPGFGMLFLDEPEGAEIKSMALDGDVLVLELVGGPQLRPNRLVIVDLRNGRVLGRINLGTAL